MRKNTFSVSVLIFLAGFLFAFSSPALADDDPPGRVARLNFIQGSISFQPGGETDWTQANPNRPLTTGDNLWADRDSRGELHIGSSSIRIGSGTGITFLNLDDRTVQIQLAQGTLNVHVRRLEGGDDFEIDTPNIAFTLERPGDYRLDVDPDGSRTTVIVRQGEGDATGGGSEYHMDSGDEGAFRGTDSVTYESGRAGRFDEFDDWSHSRDVREERAQSARYVSRDVIGYDDLDDYGEWRNTPDYGYVWFPNRVAAGWAPYRNGHWAYIAPWGWTWVEDEPWGFAPFHYGRWAEVGGGWCWVPGPVVVRPVYAPALVVFVGGPRFGTSVSFGGGGGVAWFPLGPREVYVPPYRTSVRYVQNVNVTNTTVNVTNVTNVYNNVNVNKVTYIHQNNVAAVTAVSHDTFVNARPVANANVRINPQQMQVAEVQHNVSMTPVQKSVVGSGAVATAKPPVAVMQRQVVAKETPPPSRTPFNGGPQQMKTFRPSGAPTQQPQQQGQPRQQLPPQQQQQIEQQQRSFPPQQQPPAQQPPQQQGQPRQQLPPQQQQQIQQQQRSFPPQQQPPAQQPPQQQGQPRQQLPPQQEQQIQQRQRSFPPQQQPPAQQPPQQQGQPRQQLPPQQQQQIQQQQRSFPPQQQPPAQQPQQQGQPRQQPPPQQQQQIQQQQRSFPPQQPQQQNPAVKYAPPARATEDTYHPHQFERSPAAPPQAAPPQAAPPPKAEKEPPKPAERGQDSRRDEKERK